MNCSTCGAETTATDRFCHNCGAAQSLSSPPFAETKQAFDVLRGLHEAGRLDDAGYDEELRKLVLEDSSGGYWMIGADSGKWYWHDGNRWLRRDPPKTGAAEPLPVAAHIQPMRSVQPQPTQASRSCTRITFAIVALLLIGACVAIVPLAVKKLPGLVEEIRAELEDNRTEAKDTRATSETNETGLEEAEAVPGDTGSGTAEVDVASDDSRSSVENVGTGTEDAGSSIDGMGSGSDDTGSGVEDVGAGSDDTGSGVEDASTGADDSGSGSQDAGTVSDDTGAGAEEIDSGSDDTAGGDDGSSGGQDGTTGEDIATHPDRPPGLVFDDSFDDRSGDWLEGETDRRILAVEDGEYHIFLKEPDIASPGFSRAYTYTDFGFMARAWQVTNLHAYNGLAFRVNGEVEEFYYFVVSSNGYYGVGQYHEGEWTEFIDWTYSEAINVGQGENLLYVACVGDEITVYVNDDELATVYDGSLTEGYVGFITGGFEDSGVLGAFDDAFVDALE